MDEYLIVSEEQGLFRVRCRNRAMSPGGTLVRGSIHPDDVRGKHVICHTLPLHLAAAADRVTTIKVRRPALDAEAHDEAGTLARCMPAE